MGGVFDFSGIPGLDVMEDAAIAFFAVYFLILLVSSIWSIVVYVFHSLGLHTIAKRRMIHNPWLAWIPVANLWVLGSISDQYQFMAKGKRTKRRKVLIGLVIALYALALVIGIAAGVTAGFAVVGETAAQIWIPVLILVLGYIALIVLAIVLTVFQYIAYYDLYSSCNPDNAVAFLVLGIFFSFLNSFFVFACRKKDQGIPAPQAQSQPQEPQYIPAPPVVEDVAEEASDVPVADDEDFEPEE